MMLRIFILICLISCTFGFDDQPESCTPEDQCQYQPTWDSLDSRPLPEWYDKSKFGIFIHWGVFAVPALGEWFWFNWKGYNSTGAANYMKNNFKPNFSYQDFARDFTAEWFNATEWALLFKKSGAKYVVLTSKHHEGYTLWPSKYAFSWNSMDVGPHRDLVGELATAVRNSTNLKFGLYHSLYEWFNLLYLNDKSNNFTTSKFVDFKTGPELYELVHVYKPEVIWSDGEWEASDDYWKAKEFLSWLYNKSPVKDTVVVNDRWGTNTLCKHGGFLTCTDRYNPEKLIQRKWENCMTIDKYTWGYRKNANLEDYKTSRELIQQLVITVSCGGNLLLNVGPTSEGKILPIFQERLLDIGNWLSMNGEAIYETRPWPTCQNDTFTPGVWYTTKNSTDEGQLLYATFFKWPENNTIVLKCISNYTFAKMSLVESGRELKFTNTTNGWEIQLPDKAGISMEWAWSVKLTNSRLNVPPQVIKENENPDSDLVKYKYSTV
ncbi:alpha-L-fucosidase isoform X1 [Planococcus citri]|uniref:alpha-L-fucosidase isoform X1 n=2 Tax=Planococcus citri TaxID=170843 RepID=UPI0031F96062